MVSMSEKIFENHKQAHAGVVSHWNKSLDVASTVTFEAYTKSARLARDKFNDASQSEKDNLRRLRMAAVVEVMIG